MEKRVKDYLIIESSPTWIKNQSIQQLEDYLKTHESTTRLKDYIKHELAVRKMKSRVKEKPDYEKVKAKTTIPYDVVLDTPEKKKEYIERSAKSTFDFETIEHEATNKVRKLLLSLPKEIKKKLQGYKIKRARKQNPRDFDWQFHKQQNFILVRNGKIIAYNKGDGDFVVYDKSIDKSRPSTVAAKADEMYSFSLFRDEDLGSYDKDNRNYGAEYNTSDAMKSKSQMEIKTKGSSYYNRPKMSSYKDYINQKELTLQEKKPYLKQKFKDKLKSMEPVKEKVHKIGIDYIEKLANLWKKSNLEMLEKAIKTGKFEGWSNLFQGDSLSNHIRFPKLDDEKELELEQEQRDISVAMKEFFNPETYEYEKGRVERRRKAEEEKKQ